MRRYRQASSPYDLGDQPPLILMVLLGPSGEILRVYAAPPGVVPVP